MVTIVVEGGGPGQSEHAKVRKAFQAFFKRAGLSGVLPHVVPCGSRNDAFDDFQTQLGNRKSGGVLLLVDSEGPVSDKDSAWQHLERRDKWKRPSNASDEDAHLMVQCMENWYLADPEALMGVFGKGFNQNHLPTTQDIEHVDKSALVAALKLAAKATKRGNYHKARDSWDVLSRLDPERLERRSVHAARFLRVLRDLASHFRIVRELEGQSNQP